jgi:murein tripeptide amidase MpaA
MAPSISISDTFDGGNVKFIEERPNKNDPDNVIDVIVKIKPDVYTELEEISHMQYFSFRATIGELDGPQKVNYIIDNAEDVSYPEAWTGTTVCYSDNVEDVDSWKRNQDTFYMEGKLTFEHLHETSGSVFFSYFPPYSYARHLSLVSKCEKFAYVQTLGQSVDGREIECVSLGTGDLVCWIIHRQHPGETMAEHFAEGLLTRLLGMNTEGVVDDKVKKILEIYKFYIVPCMCPDGAVLGHLRSNSCGANLNREWASKVCETNQSRTRIV